MTYPQRRRAYRRHVASIDITATTLGLTAAQFLPHPIAVMAIVGSITAALAAPFITPIGPPDPEDT